MILDQLYNFIRIYKCDFQPDRDEYIEEYVENLFKSESDDDFDPQEVELFLKDSISSCSDIPSHVFQEWIMKTRLSLVSKDAPSMKNELEDNSTDCVETILKLIPVLNPELHETDSKVDSKPQLTKEEREAYAERYGFSRNSCSLIPPVTKLSSEPESKVRYLDGKVVNTNGARYIEIKKEYPDMPPPVYLKSSRKYRFH
ncbi:unnamed protein product [Rodentolepis nana]|uniref:CUE domain-containing protein n=1 Tax=Rodentolepis nana TaxID=102285 RepID=A0A158QHW1_RODNA|nr:unnamed protein product [Rodentolepis nana]